MYDLFVLGQLMDQDMTGYQLRKALKAVVGTEQTMSYGVLYPLLERLATAGSLQLTTEQTVARTKKWAAITETGRRSFHQLVLTPVVINKQAQLMFQIKCSCLHLLKTAEKVTILQDFQAFTREQLAQLREIQAYFKDRPRMQPNDVVDELQINQLQQLRAQAQADWITSRLASLTEGE